MFVEIDCVADAVIETRIVGVVFFGATAKNNDGVRGLFVVQSGVLQNEKGGVGEDESEQQERNNKQFDERFYAWMGHPDIIA